MRSRSVTVRPRDEAEEEEVARGVMGEGAEERLKGSLKGLRVRLDTMGEEYGRGLEVESEDVG